MSRNKPSRGCKTLALGLLLLAGNACAFVEEFPLDCTQFPDNLDSTVDEAILTAQAGNESIVRITGDCLSSENYHMVDSPATLSIIGSGSASTSITIAGYEFLRAQPTSGSAKIAVKGITLKGAQGGGALAIANSSLYIEDVTFFNNRGDSFGGGIEGTNTLLTVRRSQFIQNMGAVGGAIANPSGTTDIEDSVFTGNSASNGNGGALYINTPLRLVTSVFSGNQSTGSGGALYMFTTGGDVRNVTFSGNSAINGAAIGIEAGAAIALRNVTIHNNTATTAGSAIFTSSNALTLQNTLISGSCMGLSASPSGTGNIESPGNSCALPAGNQVNVSAASLMLGALANNGGPTQTLLPAAGSALIDAGSASCEAIDQRRLLRNVGTCDVGAAEAGASIPDLIFANGLEG